MNPDRYGGDDRRKADRAAADLPVNLTVLGEGGGGRWYGGRVVNLSEEGMAIDASASAEPGVLRSRQQVSAEISLPGSPDPIRVSGQAIWSSIIDAPFQKSALLRVGLKIEKISPGDAERLRAYLANRA